MGPYRPGAQGIYNTGPAGPLSLVVRAFGPILPVCTAPLRPYGPWDLRAYGPGSLGPKVQANREFKATTI